MPKSMRGPVLHLQQQFNLEKKSMNVWFQIIPEDSSYEVSHPQQPLEQPHIAQGKIKSQKTKRVVKAQSGEDRTRRSSKHHWKAQENVRYCQFIKNNIELCKMTRYQKIKAKFNVRMSKVVKTKDPAQCRSHNQKMMIKYGTPEDIVKGLGKNFNFFKKDQNFQVRNEQMQADQQVESAQDREVQDVFKVVGQQERVY